MPDTGAIRGAIRDRIATYVSEPNPDIQWILREDVQRVGPPSGTHVIIDIIPARSHLAGSGTPRLFRTWGVLVFRIATPQVDGAGPNELIAALIEPYFRALRAGDVLYAVPHWAPAEVPDETSFIGRLVVDWQADSNEP